MPKTLCVDFDGVLHAYTSGWQGIDKANDGPVPGAMKFLIEASEHFDEVCVYSSRSINHKGVYTMKNVIKEWLCAEMGWAQDQALAFINERIQFPTQKPAAFVTLDDRAVCFNGVFPPIKSLLNFQPWNKMMGVGLNAEPMVTIKEASPSYGTKHLFVGTGARCDRCFGPPEDHPTMMPVSEALRTDEEAAP